MFICLSMLDGNFMTKVVAVDHNNLLFRSIHTRKDLSYSGQFTGGVFGYLTSLASALNQTDARRIIVCKDHKPYIRHEMVEERGYKGKSAYKGNRKPLDKDTLKKFKDSLKLTSRLLKVLGVTVLDKQGFEADDMIANFVDQHWSKYEAIYMMSNDSDLYQLFRHDNFYLLTSKGMYGYRQYHKEYKIPPEKWYKIGALTGGHNGVGGIVGVGPKTAVKLLAEGKSLSDIKEEYGDKAKHLKFFAKISKLPIQKIDVPKAQKATVNMEELADFLKSLHIKTTPQVFMALSKLSGKQNSLF